MEENYYIVRTDRAGVFFGRIKEKKENSIIMTDVRKIHYWEGAAAVEQISQDGVNESKSRLTIAISEMELDRWIQILPCSERAIINLKNCKEWKM